MQINIYICIYIYIYIYIYWIHIFRLLEFRLLLRRVTPYFQFITMDYLTKLQLVTAGCLIQGSLKTERGYVSVQG